MQVNEINSEGLKREFAVTISATDIDQKVETRLKEVGTTVRIPGFRPGKVPMKMLRSRYGQAVMGEVLERAVNDGTNQALTERGLRPAVQPKIEVTKFEEGEDLEFKIEIELLPDVVPVDFATIEIERIKLTVPDDEVQQALENLASQQKATKPLAKPRAAKKDDVLVIDFRGSVDGEELPGMAAEDHNLELGSNRFVEGFEEQLIGAKAGDEKTVTVTFPETYMNDKLAGRKAVFQVTIKEVLETEPQPIDDAFAEKLGEESLTALKDRVREQIASEYEGLTRARMKRELLDKLAEAHSFQVPASMVESEFEVIWQQVQQDREKGDVDPEDKDKSEDELKAEYRTIAERRVRLGLLLSEVGRAHKIEVTQDELNRALMQEAQRHPGHEREVFEYFQKNPQALDNLRAPVFEDKVIDYIVELAKVSERGLTAEELRQEMLAESVAAESGDKPTKAPAKKKATAKKPVTKKAAAKKADSSADAADKAPAKKKAAAKKPTAKKD